VLAPQIATLEIDTSREQALTHRAFICKQFVL
jgi:hypothetical protein